MNIPRESISSIYCTRNDPRLIITLMRLIFVLDGLGWEGDLGGVATALGNGEETFRSSGIATSRGWAKCFPRERDEP